MLSNNKIYVGYDSRESICYDVCQSSVLANTLSSPHILPIKLDSLSGIYNRAPDPLASTEFTYTRFLVPHLNEYKEIALFCDCDFLFLEDVNELFKLYDERYAVMVCKHNYEPKNITKMDGCIQSTYPKKNWSSLILWNCSHPKNKILTPEIVNTQTGKFLHRFEWLDEEDIGTLPIQWNWLVGWYKEPQDGAPKALHYTEGGPWFEQHTNCEYADVWKEYKNQLS